MITDETPASDLPTRGRAHGGGLPHSHGGAGRDHTHSHGGAGRDHTHSHGGAGHNHSHSQARPHLHLAASDSGDTARFSPSFSILRTSLPVRLGLALFGSALTWAAFHWAIQ